MLSVVLRRCAMFALVSCLLAAWSMADASGIVSVQIGSRADQSQSNVPVTFGQVFKPGDVGGQQPIMATLDGQSVPLQVDRKATNADGSLRHAIFTAMIPTLPGHGIKVLTLSAGNHPSSAAPVSLKQLLATGFNARVLLDVSGVTYSADVRQMLKDAEQHNDCRPWGRTCNVWLAGALAGDWIVAGPVKTAGGATDASLSVRFDVRYYPGSGQVRVGVVVDNDWTYGPNPQNIKYDAHILINGQEKYTKLGLLHSAHARWRKVFWTRTKPAVYVKHDLAYLEAAGAVPYYDLNLKISQASIANLYKRFQKSNIQPMQVSFVTKKMPITGGRGDIGPLPQWTALRLISMDPRLIEADNTINDLSGSWPIHYRDEDTGRPVSLERHPNITIHWNLRNSAGYVPTGPANPYGLQPDWSHEPDYDFVPYLLTGDYYYLEELQFWASWNPLTTSPSYRGYDKGLYDWTQVRGQAWSLRTLGQTAYITPDNDPMKGYWKRQIENNIEWYNSHYANDPAANKLGILVHNTPYNHYRALAPWQDDFFTWAVGYLVNLGFTNAKPMLDYKAKFSVGRMTAEGFCWAEGSAYELNMRDSKNSPLYDTFAKMYAESFGPKVRNAKCVSQTMANLISKRPGQYKPGDMSGYPWSAEGFPSNMQPALAVAVDAGIPNADKAWKIFMGRTTKPYGKKSYSIEPNFDIVPRPRNDGVSELPNISFFATPDQVQPGGKVTLKWSVAHAVSCSAPWTDQTATTGTQQVGPVDQATGFTLTCAGAESNAMATVKVALQTSQSSQPAPPSLRSPAPPPPSSPPSPSAAPTMALTAAPAQVAAGQRTTLAWSSRNADKCVASGAWSGVKLSQGQVPTDRIDQDEVFTLTCTGSGGQTSHSVKVATIAQRASTTPETFSHTSDPPSSSLQSTGGSPVSSGGGGGGGGGAFGLLGLLWLLGVGFRLKRQYS